MRERRCGSTTPQDDDRDSLHSLFSESNTGCGSGAMGLIDQNARHQEAIPEFSRPNDTPSCSDPGEIFATDQCAFSMVLDGHDTPGQPRSNQQELNEREPHAMTVQPVRQTSQSPPSPTCYDANFQEHRTSCGEANPLNDVDMQSASSHSGEIQIDTNNLKADHHHEG